MKGKNIHLCLEEPLIFERGKTERKGVVFNDERNITEIEQLHSYRRKSPLTIPELTEGEVVRHFTRLSSWNFSVDHGFYPLGSCTMKYNPRVGEWACRLEGFATIHPFSPEDTIQGALELMYHLEKYLCSICGFSAFTLQPSAGAHGELTSVLMIRKYLEKQGNPRKKILVPDTAHGTNPASCAISGYTTVKVPSGKDGILEPETVKQFMDEDVAAIMITNPNTLGLFEKNIKVIADIVHERGGVVFGDGANLNALIGKIKPGEIGIDIMQINLHKTFSTPHGGGGPGSGPVGVADKLVEFLPVPRVKKSSSGKFYLDYNLPNSIGMMRSFYGNFGVMTRAYAYLLTLGRENLHKIAEMSVLNANYLMHLIKDLFYYPYPATPMHEFVVTDKVLKKATGVDTTDIAKRLIDMGFHPPTIHFPIVVHGAIMIEPTETESVEEIERFAEALRTIVTEAKNDPEIVKSAPQKTRIGRPDETLAARKPVLKWAGEEENENKK